jgi:hypothetical protein
LATGLLFYQNKTGDPRYAVIAQITYKVNCIIKPQLVKRKNGQGEKFGRFHQFESFLEHFYGSETYLQKAKMNGHNTLYINNLQG